MSGLECGHTRIKPPQCVLLFTKGAEAEVFVCRLTRMKGQQ